MEVHIYLRCKDRIILKHNNKEISIPPNSQVYAHKIYCSQYSRIFLRSFLYGK